MPAAMTVPSERPGQPGGRRDQNRKERTQALFDAALALFLERGIEAVTIEDITTQAGVAKGSFYRYFEDKAGLVNRMFAPLIDDVAGTFDASVIALERSTDEASALASYEILGEGIAKVVFGNSDLVRLYLQENRAPGHAAPRRLASLVVDKATAHSRLARDRGLIRAFPAEVSTLVVIGAVERLAFAVLAGEDAGDITEIPGALVSLILDGIRAKR